MVLRIGKAALAAALGLSLLSSAACTHTQATMGTGAALGVGGGALVAAAAGGSVLGGAIVGGALGTGAGFLIAQP